MAVAKNWSSETIHTVDMSPEDRDQVIKINTDKATVLMPVIIYTATMMTLGVVGNPIAMYIYGWRWQQSTTRIFLLYLAAIDFISCIVTMPTEIYIMLNFYYFHNAFLCTISRFFTYCYNNSTSVVFLVIAFDRYIRICHPHKDAITIAGSKVACFIAFCVGVGVSWPALILYGNNFVFLGRSSVDNSSIHGVMCGVRNSMDSTPYPLGYFIYLWCGFTSSLCILTVLYVCIGRVMLQRRRKKTCQMSVLLNVNRNARTDDKRDMKGSNVDDVKWQNNEATACDTQKLPADVGTGRFRQDSHGSPVDNETMHAIRPEVNEQNTHTKKSTHIVPMSHRYNSAKHSLRHSIHRTSRSTLMLFAITAVFLVSFLPFLIVMTIRQYSGPRFYPSLSPTKQVLVNLFSRSYLVNSCANPIVYGLCNTQFRTEVKKLLRMRYQDCTDSLSRIESIREDRSCSC